jgi:hypothetical protein
MCGFTVNDMTRRQAEAVTTITPIFLQIPMLTYDNVATGVVHPNMLVRYVGMVQDMFEPEWFAPLKTDRANGTSYL